MTLRSRRYVFYSFIFIFIAAGIGVVFYSQGWRPVVDCKIAELQNCKIAFQKTGAVFIETNPKGVEIKINNKNFQDKSGLLQSGTLVADLLPKTYKIEIKKNGFFAWTKNVSVKSGMVAETGKVILIPEKISGQEITIPKPAGAFWGKNGKLIFSSGGALYYSNQNGAVKLKGNAFAAWSEDGNKFITQDSQNNAYYLYDANNTSTTINLNLLLTNIKKTSVYKVAFHPADSNKLIIEGKNGLLYITDINRLTAETLNQKPISSFTINNPNIFYVVGKEIHSFNLLLKADNLKFQISEDLATRKITEISSNGDAVAALFQNGELYIFNGQNPSGVKIAEAIKKTIVSPDNKKLAFWDANGELNIFFFDDYQKEITKKSGDISLLKTYGNNGVKNVFWYKDSRYLIVETAKNIIEFIEIDDRQPINNYVLSEKSYNVYYDQNRLYFLKENKIYFAEI